MALRLKLPHEARGRMSPKLRPRLKSYGGLDGEKEVWMHIAPSTDDLRCKAGRGCATKQKGEGADNVEDITKSSYDGKRHGERLRCIEYPCLARDQWKMNTCYCGGEMSLHMILLVWDDFSDNLWDSALE